MQAAVGLAQLEKLPLFIETRKRNWKIPRNGLNDLSDFFIFQEPTPNSDPCWFGFLMIVKENAGFTRDEIVRYLEENKIQTRMLFAGNIIRQPCFDELRKSKGGYRVVGELSNTDLIMNNAFLVGVYPGINEDMLNYVIEKIRYFCQNFVKK
jgi:CDP-6-deoxy-D-xylo-4-hexulose-3-dehydrase